MNFSDFSLKPTLLEAICAKGYEKPTEIQKKAIPLLTSSDIDFVGQAQTGTGKTAAFLLPLLNRIDINCNELQALILVPTRELALQVCGEIRDFAVKEKFRSLEVYGGTPLYKQKQDVKRVKPHIIVGTPGRVLDFVNRKVLVLSKTKYAVLDEADEMLNMGFIEDVQLILDQFSAEKTTWLFSATMPRPIMKLVNEYLHTPHFLKVKQKTLTNDDVDQSYYVVAKRNHDEALLRILDSLDDYFVLVFCRTRIESKLLSDHLNSKGLSADALHGDMDQSQREITMKRFREKKIKILACTDVAARGIDIDNITHVVNYGMPQHNEAYIHRIGRTGRAGVKGQAISLIDPGEKFRINQIERLTSAKISLVTLPTAEELSQALVKREMDKINTHKDLLQNKDSLAPDKHLGQFKKYFDEVEREDIIKIMYSYILKANVDKYKSTCTLDVGFSDSKKRRKGMRIIESGNVRFFVNMGKGDGLTLRTLLQSVSNKVKVQERKIRNVDMKNTFSFFEVPVQYREKVLGLNNIKINDRKVRFEVSKGRS